MNELMWMRNQSIMAVDFPRAAHGDATNTYSRRRSAAATAPIRRFDEPQEDEDMEDDNSDE
jgi:hypothetical protein